MENRLDIVAIRVQYERAVVTGMIRPFARRTVVPTTRRKRRLMETLHRFAIRCLESEMNPGNVIIGFVYEQLIGVEKAWPLVQYIVEPQRRENRAIEGLAGVKVGNPQVHMVNEPASVKLHGDLLVDKNL